MNLWLYRGIVTNSKMNEALLVLAEGPKLGAALKNRQPFEVQFFFRINLGKAW